MLNIWLQTFWRIINISFETLRDIFSSGEISDKLDTQPKVFICFPCNDIAVYEQLLRYYTDLIYVFFFI